jgi:biotin operon repressor
MEGVSMGDDNTNARPEDMRTEIKISRTVDESIAKLKAQGFQYATAGDARRLIEEIERLRSGRAK